MNEDFAATHDDRICMGQLLLAGGFLDPDQLKEALAENVGHERRLGEILEDKKALTHEETIALLHLQEHLQDHLDELAIYGRPGSPLPEALHLSLGQLLLENEQITQAQLQAALTEHKTTHKHLGETLVVQQVITEQTLEGWLGIQQKLMTAASAAILLVGFASPVAADFQYERPFADDVAAISADMNSSSSNWGDGWGDKQLLNQNIERKHVPIGEFHLDEEGEARLVLSKRGVEFSRKF